VINHEAIHLAARARARTLQVATVDAQGTVARASEASYVDVAGLTQFAAVDEARTAHYVGGVGPSFLSEAAGVNLIADPTDWRTAAWSEQPALSTAVAAPVVGANVYTLADVGGAGFSAIARQLLTPNASGRHVLSFYMRSLQASGVTVTMRVRDAALTLLGEVPATVIFGQPFIIGSSFPTFKVDARNQWFRIGFEIDLANTDPVVVEFAAVGGASGAAIYASSAQFEEGTALTSFIRAGVRAADTGTPTQLAATATGYTRASGSGSFLTDGFAVGMDVTPTGFTQTTPATITSVSALAMTVRGGRTAQMVGTASLTSGLPVLIGYENISITPTTDTPYCVEEYLPGALAKVTVGAFGELEATPLYVLRLLYPQHTGMTALRRTSDALLTLFAPGTPLTVGSDIARVRSDLAPFPSPITQTEDGWASCTVTIPLRLRTNNSR